jgi:L-fuculose-phosphate aldolase
MKDAKLRRAVIETARAMNASGLNQGTAGNVSTRAKDGFLITPSGIPYDDLKPEQIVRMDLDGGYEGDWLPSSEWRMHLDLYRGRSEAAAIVHTHSCYATALSSLRREIPAFHYMVAVTGGPVLRCADYATFGTAELSDAMLCAMEGRSACLLANHGAIAFGENLKRALWRMGEVEQLAKQYFIACQMGQPVVLPDEEMGRVLRRFASYGKQAGERAEDDPDVIGMPTRRDNGDKDGGKAGKKG